MKQFGTTLQETVRAFRVQGGGARAAEDPKIRMMNAVVRIVVSLVVLATGIFFASSDEPNRSKMGMTLIGVVTGYWLK